MATTRIRRGDGTGRQPLNVENQSKPNILLTVDGSTSMLFDFLPDTVIGEYCRDITGSMNGTAAIRVRTSTSQRGPR